MSISKSPVILRLSEEPDCTQLWVTNKVLTSENKFPQLFEIVF